MKRQKRAPNPTISNEDIAKLYDFALRHGGTCKIHNHRKTIERWER